MSDIYTASDKFHAILFADGSNLTSTLCSFNVSLADYVINKLQLSKNINAELNKISLNVKKPNLWYFTIINLSKYIPDLKITGQSIERVRKFNIDIEHKTIEPVTK